MKSLFRTALDVVWGPRGSGIRLVLAPSCWRVTELSLFGRSNLTSRMLLDTSIKDVACSIKSFGRPSMTQVPAPLPEESDVGAGDLRGISASDWEV